MPSTPRPKVRWRNDLKHASLVGSEAQLALCLNCNKIYLEHVKGQCMFQFTKFAGYPLTELSWTNRFTLGTALSRIEINISAHREGHVLLTHVFWDELERKILALKKHLYKPPMADRPEKWRKKRS